MKNMKILICFALALLLAACTSEDEPVFETTFSDFGYATGDLAIDLTQSDAGNLRLEWENSVAVNSTLVFYRVLFSGNKDDFSDPVHEIETDRLGTAAYLTVAPAAMNIIAEKAGVRQNTSGNVYWSVHASNGISTKTISGEAKKITVTRPAGFAAFPEKLYLTGAATPGGDDIEQALVLKASKKKADATQDSAFFNIVVPLKQGEFRLVNAKQGRVRSFGFDDNGKIIEIFEGDNLKNEVPADGLYHLGLNFQTNTADYGKIEQVDLIVVRSGQPEDVVATLNYTSDYTWKTEFLSRLSNGSNLPAGAMYKFRFTETAVKGGQTNLAYWGSTSETATPPTADAAESYFYVTRVNSDTKNYYRFPTSVSGSNSGKAMKAVLVMNPNNDHFYHSNTVAE
ncbi:MAG: SusE domain-containing protein [Prevotella sp.]|jgi:hypothetical protein|nr:SusE domain-containing protein [Prevotella sp.]